MCSQEMNALLAHHMMRPVLGGPRVPCTVTHSQRATEERILEKSTQPQTGLPADLSHISEQMVGWNAAFVIHFSWVSLKTPPYRGHVSPPPTDQHAVE